MSVWDFLCGSNGAILDTDIFSFHPEDSPEEVDMTESLAQGHTSLWRDGQQVSLGSKLSQ